MSELSDLGRLHNRPLRGFATHREANTPSEASAEFATGATSPESDEDAADMSVKRMRRATKYDDGDSSMNGAGGGGRNRGSERRAALNGVERARKCQARRLFAPRCTGERHSLSEGTFERSENPKGAQAGAPNTAFSDEAICAGLRPEGVLVYAK